MPTVSLDFGGVGQIPPEGTYRIVVDKAVYKQNKAKDGWIINLQMHLVDMPDETFENFKMFDNPSLKPQALWKVKEMLDAFTFPKEWVQDGMEIEVDDDNIVSELVDQTALAVIVHGEYQNKPQAQIQLYLPDNGQVEIGESKSL